MTKIASSPNYTWVSFTWLACPGRSVIFRVNDHVIIIPCNAACPRSICNLLLLLLVLLLLLLLFVVAAAAVARAMGQNHVIIIPCKACCLASDAEKGVNDHVSKKSHVIKIRCKRNPCVQRVRLTSTNTLMLNASATTCPSAYRRLSNNLAKRVQALHAAQGDRLPK